MEIPDIVDRIQSCLVGGRFSKDAHLVLTGGEPLLWQSQIPALLDEIRVRAMDLTDLTFETNGTVELSNDLFFALLDDVDHGLTITFSVSPKLPCSGETWESSILPGVVMGYADFPNSRTYLKFVVGDAQDFEDVQNAVKEYRAAGFQGSIYVMPIGGTTESYYLNNKKVCELAITHGYRYSPRLQVDLYGNAWSK
jgi:7-carboxy-7-deazaguanine synthase